MANIKPIRTEEDYDAALARMDEIFFADDGTLEGDERDILFDLIELYEDKHYPIGPPSDLIAHIEFLMEQQGLTEQDLVPCIGNLSEVAAVLSRQQDITMPMARALHKHLGIPAETLLQDPTRTSEAAYSQAASADG